MLVPLTRQKLEQLIPIAATAEQYRYYWGKFPDFLQRLLISVVSVVVIWILELAIGGYKFLALPVGIAAGLYWLWGPVLWAGLRNAKYRKYPYGGFWRGKVLDVFVSEELISTEETVNDRGELVIVENRERRINLEVGDETGFTKQLQASLQREHQRIAPGQVAEMVVLSNQPDLSRIAKVTDVYIPSLRVWVSDYPYLNRDMFESVSQQLSKPGKQRRSRRNDDRRYDQGYDDQAGDLYSDDLDEYAQDSDYDRYGTSNRSRNQYDYGLDTLDEYDQDSGYDHYSTEDYDREPPLSARRSPPSARRSSTRRYDSQPDDWANVPRRRSQRPK